MAPATFKVATEVKNAQLAVWDLAEGRPLEVGPASAGRVERLVTFEKPGGYLIKLAAFNGQQHEEKSLAINVLLFIASFAIFLALLRSARRHGSLLGGGE